MDYRAVRRQQVGDTAAALRLGFVEMGWNECIGRKTNAALRYGFKNPCRGEKTQRARANASNLGKH